MNALKVVDTLSGDFAAPLGSVTRGRLIFKPGAANVSIHADSTLPDLCRASFKWHRPSVWVQDGTVTIHYRDYSFLNWLVYGWREPLAEVTLNGSIPWQVEFHGGVSRHDADLRGLALRSIEIYGGVSDAVLMLPKPSGVVRFDIHGGASHLTVRRPIGTALRFRIQGGISGLAFDEQRYGSIGGESILATPGFDSTADRYEIEVFGGASSVRIDTL